MAQRESCWLLEFPAPVLRKRPAAPRGREEDQVVEEVRSGSSSSMRLLGQVGNFSSVSRSHAYGARPLSLAVPSKL
jgi:hypothetical protein